MADGLLEAVRRLWLAVRGLVVLGLKPLLAKLREQQPDLGAATREVREALIALKAEESEAAKAAAARTLNSAAALPAADEGVPPATDAGGAPPVANEGGAPPNVAVSLACVGCGRLPSDMDDEREKHPVCRKCRKLKLPTTYCGAASTARGTLALRSCTWHITRRRRGSERRGRMVGCSSS